MHRFSAFWHMRLPHRLQGQKVKSQSHGAGAYCGGHLAAQLVLNHFRLYTVVKRLLLWTPAQRSLSEVHVMFRECYFLIILWPPYAPAQVNGGQRNFYTWWTLSVNREVTTWIFSWSSLNYRDGPKSDEIWHIVRPRPQTFCSPNAAEYCNSEKKTS